MSRIRGMVSALQKRRETWYCLLFRFCVSVCYLLYSIPGIFTCWNVAIELLRIWLLKFEHFSNVIIIFLWFICHYPPPLLSSSFCHLLAPLLCLQEPYIQHERVRTGASKAGRRQGEGLSDPEVTRVWRWKSDRGRPIVTDNVCPKIHYMFLLPLSSLPLGRSTWVMFKLNAMCRYAWVREAARGRESESNVCLVKSLLNFLLHYTSAFPQIHARVTLRHQAYVYEYKHQGCVNLYIWQASIQNLYCCTHVCQYIIAFPFIHLRALTDRRCLPPYHLTLFAFVTTRLAVKVQQVKWCLWQRSYTQPSTGTVTKMWINI